MRRLTWLASAFLGMGFTVVGGFAAACGGADAAPSDADAGPGASTGPATTSSASAPSTNGTSSSPPSDAGAPPSDAGKGATPPGPTKYDADGPSTYTSFKKSITSNHDTFDETIYVPDGTGPFPLVSLEPGTLQSASAYIPYAKRLASWGFVVVMRDDPGVLTANADIIDDIAFVISTWLPAQTDAPLAGAVDLTRVGLTGHSRGGKLTLNVAEGALKGKVKAWFGIDAVDLGIPPDTNQARTTIAQLGFPLAFLGGGVATGCAPVTDSSDMLFDASASPSVSVTAINASHTQFEDQASCNACQLCTPMGTADSNVVLAYSIRYLTAYFARELLGDTAVGAAFQGAGGPADVAAGRVTISSK